MQYLSFSTKAEAMARSAEEAAARDCQIDSTTHWWPWRVDPETGAAVLLINDGDALPPRRDSQRHAAWMAVKAKAQGSRAR